MSNVVFIFVLAFSIYETGRMLWGRSTGLLAMLGILCSPMFIGQFKEYQLDAQLSAMVALSLCLLIKTKEFSDKKHSMLFGLSLGLGMLTKWTFIGCLALPLVYSAINGVWISKSNKKENQVNLIWAVFLGLMVSLIWYGNHPHMLWGDFIGVRRDFKEAPMSLAEVSFWYACRFEKIQMYILPTLFFLFGFVSCFFKKDWFKRNIYPFLLIVGSYLFFTLLKHDIRYTMPMLVGCFIFAVNWFELIKSTFLRVFLKTVFVFYCVFTFTVLSAGTHLFPLDISIGPLVLFNQTGYGVGAPDTTDWHQEEVFQMISEDNTGVKDVYWKGPSPDNIRFNNWGIVYYALKYHVNIVNNVLGGDFVFKPDYHPGFILERTTEKKISYPGYRLYQEFVLPDQSELFLLKKI
jgi:4-amino-4-deoxy-L-arabinose transferase-like glycosyltransferase